MPSSLARFGAVLAALSPAVVATLYDLGDSYTGSTFLDGFDFFTAADPQSGFVKYIDRVPATNSRLVRTIGDDTYLGVDFTTPLTVNGPGRSSVRIESKKTYQEGLFIVDLKHMPSSTCGTWPKFWSVGEGQPPYNGQINIIEGVNRNTDNTLSLNTYDNCKTNGAGQTGSQNKYDCALVSGGTSGCDVSATSPLSYGNSFNAANGGVYAMEWTKDAIKVWLFPRNAIPDSITADAPNTAQFGLPLANFAGDCDFRSKFVNHRFIFDIDFCGEKAGGVYSQSGCPQYPGLAGMDSCKRFVAQNPSAFSQSYWLISSFKTFKTAGMTSSSSSSSVESSTSTSSSSFSTSEAASSTSSEDLTSSSSEAVTSSSESIASSTSSDIITSASSEIATSTSSEVVSSTSSSEIVSSASSFEITSSTSSDIIITSASSDIATSTSSEVVSSTSSSEIVSSASSFEITSSTSSSEIVSSTSTSEIVSSTSSDIDISTSTSEIDSSTSSSEIASSTSTSDIASSTSSEISSSTEASISTSDVASSASETLSSSSSSSSTDVSSSAVITDVSSSSYEASSSTAETTTYDSTPSSSTTEHSTIIYPTGTGGYSVPASDVIYPIANSTSCSTSTSSFSHIPEYAVPTTAPGYPSPSSAPEYVTKTYTTTFVDVCSTGYTTVSTTYTATYEKPTAAVPTSKEYPEGFTTTVKYCPTGCGTHNTFVTVTVPCTKTPYNAGPTPVDTPYNAQPTGPHYDENSNAPNEYPSSGAYPPAEEYPSEGPSDYPSSPIPYEPSQETPSQGVDSYPEYEEETTVIYATSTQVVTLSIVPVPASEYYASLSSAASPAGEYPAGQPAQSYQVGPSAGYPAYPSSNATAGYGTSTGAGNVPSKTDYGDVPLFTGAAVTLKISGFLGGAVAALFALVM